MKFIKRKDFLQLPAGTIYQEWEPCDLGRIYIKGDTSSNHWWRDDPSHPWIAGAGNDSGDQIEALIEAAKSGASIMLEFDVQARDSHIEPDDTLIAVWEFGDVANLIERLKSAAADGYGLSYTEGLTGFKCDSRETYVTQWLERDGPNGLPTFVNVGRNHWPAWARELLAKLPSRDADMAQGRILTCVYCGHEYPQNTPAHSDAALTEHIKVCSKHPMREAEAKIGKLRAALIGMTEVSDPELLHLMIAHLERLPDTDGNKVASIAAMRALIETADDLTVAGASE